MTAITPAKLVCEISEREIAVTPRGKAVTKLVKKEAEKIVVNEDNIDDHLGVKKHRFAGRSRSVGVVTGLAYTSVWW
jgi:ATP-dependent Lon protease